MRHFLDPIQGTDVIKGINGRAQAAMETENLVIDECGEGKVVEEVGKALPDTRVAVLTQALIVEAVNLCDLAGLVIATKDCDALWVTNLKSNE